MAVSDEIKSRLDLVDVVREYIPNLKPVGVNFSALSPFKREKTPSFIVSPDKQIWHCFSSGKGGDVIAFVMEMEGLSFVEALRVLAPKAGVALRHEDVRQQSQKNRLLEIMEEATNFYHQKLTTLPPTDPIRQYLVKRKLSEKTMMEWQIGFSPDSWNDLLDYLKSKGFRENEILAAGLVSKKEGRNDFYNRFRGRIMFPINDINGNAVAFTARVSPEKEKTEPMGKYINSPQTALYDKSRILFGLDKAKMIIKDSGLAIVVEGQMDCISLHQAGFKNVVASSGTALTAEQLKLIKRYTNNIALCFDMDEAGQIAADRGVSSAMAEEMNIKVIILPTGSKDPDEVIKKDPALWTQAVKEAKHVMDYNFEKIFSKLDLEKVEDKREAVKIILPILAKFKNKIERDFWLKKLSEKIDIEERVIRDIFSNSFKKEKTKKEEPPAPTEEARVSREEKLSEILLSLAIKFPAFLEYIFNKIEIESIFGAENKKFYKNLIIYYNNKESSSFDNLYSWFLAKNDENQIKLLEKLAILGDKDFFDCDEDKAKSEIIKIEKALAEKFLFQRKKEVEKMIIEAEKEGNSDEAKKLMEDLKILSEELGKNKEE